MANGNATIIVGSARLGSARLGSARQEHSAVFSACQVLFHTIYNESVAGDRVTAFCQAENKEVRSALHTHP
jgi:hypothetical protein